MCISGFNPSLLFMLFTDDPVFVLDRSTGILKTSGQLDVDPATGGTASYLVVVEATDGGTSPQIVRRTLLVGLTDVNDNPPAFLTTTLSRTLLETNCIVGTSIALMAASDDDVTSTLAYTIFSGDLGGYFEFNAGTANLLQLKTAIEPDTPTNAPLSHSLQIHVTDGGTLTGTAYVTVIITPEEDNSPVFGTTVPASPVSVRYILINYNGISVLIIWY
jgi:hypothetical protein